jgi:hypothetical protein
VGILKLSSLEAFWKDLLISALIEIYIFGILRIREIKQ